jgi:hypothetical protein
MAQAIVTSAYRKVNEKSIETADSALKRQIPALEKMLWGGTVLLIVDHILNGELTWRYPFFTALDGAEGFTIMLREMLTVGVPMSLTLTAVWAVYAMLKERRKVNVNSEATQQRS